MILEIIINSLLIGLAATVFVLAPGFAWFIRRDEYKAYEREHGSPYSNFMYLTYMKDGLLMYLEIILGESPKDQEQKRENEISRLRHEIEILELQKRKAQLTPKGTETPELDEYAAMIKKRQEQIKRLQ